MTPSDGTILFLNTMRIKDGHLDGFREAVRQAVRFVDDHGPQLMVQVFVDEELMLAHSFQLYRDSEAVLTHWQLSDPYIRDVMEHCDVEQFGVYGEASEAVREGLRSLADQGIEMTMTPWLTGFLRLPTQRSESHTVRIS